MDVSADPLSAGHGPNLREALLIASEALGRYKLRTSLSVLGVVLGVSAVIAMMSVSEGARRQALEQVQSLGLDNLVARNRLLTAGETAGRRNLGLTVDDADRLTALVPSTLAVSPLVERQKHVGRAGLSARTSVVGIRASYQTILNLRVSGGRLISPVDDASSARVCVLGASLARRVFGYDPPVGDAIRVDGEYCEIIGVLGSEGGASSGMGTMAWRDLDSAVLMPLGALSSHDPAIEPDQRIDEIWLRAVDGDHVETTAQMFRRALSVLHLGASDFDVVVPRELLTQRIRTQQTFSVVVGSVAGLALLVGGIGIMNIMLTSVVERTHEIGIRRTVGATRRDITLQFLTEATLMTVGGGLAGILLGAAVSLGITAYAGWATRVSLLAVTLAFAVSISVGLVFGIYPARKAAQLEPIDALRYE